MKRIKLNKKSIFIFVLILGIGTTLAYFTSNLTIPNIFNSAKYETTTTEQFTSPSNWKPGDTTPKTVITTNNSNMPIRVRISVEEAWTDNNDNELNLEENGTLAAILNLDNRPDWIYEDGYYYYRYDVDPGDSTNSFIKSVTFNEDIVGEYICTTENNIEQCDSASDTYQDANYKLNIIVETTQANNYLESWGLEHQPRRVDPTYCTYNGELEIGTEYVNGQYTYRYKQEQSSYNSWTDMEEDGWSVYLTDRNSTDPVTSTLCTYINDIPITHVNYMFSRSKASYVDTSSFDTREIKSMYFMIGESVTSAPQKEMNIDLSNFETGKVTNMDGLLSCLIGDNIDVSSFDTSNVESMDWMFYKSDLNNIDISNWDTSNVNSMKYMFRQANIKSIDFSNFKTDSVTNMNYLFSAAKGKSHLDLTSFNTSKVTSMYNMFSSLQVDSIDVSSFDTSNVTDMSGMFRETQATTLDLSSFDTSNVTNMYSMFNGAENLEEIIGIENLDVSKVTNFRSMFYGPNKLTRLDLKKWNTQSAGVIAFDRMFRDCNILEYLDIRNFDTSAATTYESFLCNLYELTYLNMSNFDSQNVNSFHYFVVNMKKIKEHDFSSLKTSNVTDMSYLFHWNYALEKLYISDLWDTSAVTNTSYMFQGNTLLTGDINNKYTMKPRINNLAISDTSTRTIHVGESITIPSVTATYTDNSVVVKNSEDLIWKSSDLDVAKANLGVVKGISPGTATITIKSGIVETTFNVNIIE